MDNPKDPLAIAGTLGHADTRMMFERFGHLFNHSAQRVAKSADRILAALEPTVVQLSYMPQIASVSRASKKNAIPSGTRALSWWR